MTFLELVNTRKSFRQYLPDVIEPEKMDYVLECVRLAPSAANLQPWYFFIAESEDAKQAIRECYPKGWFQENKAPVYIVACANTDKSWKRGSDGKDHADIDISIAVEHLCLAAAEQGLGTCWICNFDLHACREKLHLPAELQPIAITPLGYPVKDSIRPTTRKSKDEICKII